MWRAHGKPLERWLGSVTTVGHLGWGSESYLEGLICDMICLNYILRRSFWLLCGKGLEQMSPKPTLFEDIDSLYSS